MDGDQIAVEIERIKSYVVELEGKRHAAVKALKEADTTIERLGKELAETRDELMQERQLGIDAVKELATFKEKVQEFLS